MTQRILHITADDVLTLPAIEATTQTIVVYGGRGMGKTNLGAVLCEEFAAAGRRFCYLDPIGVAWGIRHSADGKGDGLKILILGGRHGDLPIEPTGGRVIADFVATAAENVLIDISCAADGRRWSIGQKIRFVADYLERLLEVQGEHRRPLMQMIDECARFAPQTIEFKDKDADIVRCKFALEVLVEEGRNGGVGVTMLTQRSARMAKSVSELAEMMVAFRIVGPNSTAAVLDWFGEHVPKARHHEMLEQLRKLPRGVALVVSPGWLEYEGAATIRLRHTFDSSKTPTGAEQRLAKLSRPADLERLKARIAETVEKAEGQDPRHLQRQLADKDRRIKELERTKSVTPPVALAEWKGPTKREVERAGKIAELQQQLARHRRALEQAMRILVKIKALGFDVDGEDGQKQLEQAIAAAVTQVMGPIEKRVRTLAEKVQRAKAEATAAETEIDSLLKQNISLDLRVEKRAPFAVTPSAAPRAARPPRPVTPPPDGMTGPMVKILTSVAELEALGLYPCDKQQVGLLAGYTNVRSGGFAEPVGALIAAGYLDSPQTGQLTITDAGRQAAGPVTPPASSAELQDRIMEKLTGPERKLLQIVIDRYPKTITKEDLAAACDPPYTNTRSGGFAEPVGHLNMLRLIRTPEKGVVVASPALFLEDRASD